MIRARLRRLEPETQPNGSTNGCRITAEPCRAQTGAVLDASTCYSILPSSGASKASYEKFAESGTLNSAFSRTTSHCLVMRPISRKLLYASQNP